jgi:hypothetical protein
MQVLQSGDPPNHIISYTFTMFNQTLRKPVVLRPPSSSVLLRPRESPRPELWGGASSSRGETFGASVCLSSYPTACVRGLCMKGVTD